MPIKAPPPSEMQPNPYLPSGPEPLLMEDFQGLNTATTRPGVPDKQCSWIDGFMPIAPRNLRTLPGTAAFYTPGTPIVFFAFGNINAAPLMILIFTDGSAVQFNTDTASATIILAPGTITAPSITNVGISQWGDQYIIIVANQTNGYWLWDGTTVYKAGTLSPVVTLTNVGSGYSSAPIVSASGGNGSGSSLVATIDSTTGIVTGVSVVAPGTGYLATDTPSVFFSGGNSGGSGASITAALTSGSVTSLSIVAGGTLYSNHPQISFVGSATINAIATVVGVTGGSITSVNIINTGRGYASAPTVVITDVKTDAAATLQLMPYGVQGTAVETYSGRVWVAKGATIFFTAPGSFSNFATSAGGGNFTSVDSFLQVGFKQLISTNGFLYLVADSSINYISGVQTSGSPPTTTFTNQNADPQAGTPYPASVEVFGREIIFANSFGIHTCNGGAVTKISEMLDGVYNTVANFGALQLSSAQALIFGKKVWMFLVRIVDPVSGSTVNKLLMSAGKKDQWWASEQNVSLTFIRHQEIQSVITAWGTDGTSVYKLFTVASAAFQKTVQSKLWDAPGGYQFSKASVRLWLMALLNSAGSPNILATIDGIAEDGAVLSNTYTLTPSGTGYFLPKQAVGQNGVLTGMTIKTSSPDLQLISAMLQDENVGYRG